MLLLCIRQAMKMKILLKAVLAQVALRGLAETTCLPSATGASDRRELVNLLAGEHCGFQNGIPNSSARCRILPRVHVICEYHFFWQENFTDCDRSFQKILKCHSVFSEIYNKMVISFCTSSIRGCLTERRILSHWSLAKCWLCCGEVDGPCGADCDPGGRFHGA